MEEYTNSQKKQKPVILLLDTSGSMGGTYAGDPSSKISQLNRGVRGMLTDFAKLRTLSCEFFISIITFGGDSAKIIQDYTPLKNITWHDLEAGGCTPLGDALNKAKAIIEDETKLPRTNAYRPTVILMSDGIPTDDWEDAMKRFTQDGRTKKCDRFVASILGGMEGSQKREAEETLAQFVDDTTTRMFKGENATDICEFMSFMSNSVCSSSTSTNPNKTPIGNLQQEVRTNSTNISDDWGSNENNPNGLSFADFDPKDFA